MSKFQIDHMYMVHVSVDNGPPHIVYVEINQAFLKKWVMFDAQMKARKANRFSNPESESRYTEVTDVYDVAEEDVGE